METPGALNASDTRPAVKRRRKGLAALATAAVIGTSMLFSAAPASANMHCYEVPPGWPPHCVEGPGDTGPGTGSGETDFGGTDPTQPAPSFRDVPAGMQFATEISWMNSKGISTGWSDNTYRPLQPVARDAMSAFMYRLAGSPTYTAPKKSPFKDIVLGQQFYKEMSWLSATKVSTGWDDRSYRPLSSVNRDAMAAFMYRLAGSPAYTPPKKSPFTDVPVSSQFYKEISWLAAQGISTGWQQANGTRVYKPLEPVKRDAMAAFMYRFDQKGYKLPGAK